MKDKLMFILILFLAGSVNAANGITVYVNTSASNTTPQYRIWNGTGFGAQRSTGVGTGTLQWLNVISSPVRYEAILGSLDASGDIIFSVYDGNTDTWGNTVNISRIGNVDDDKMAFDIAYEGLSGNALVIYANSTNNTAAAYMVWNGSVWSAESLTLTDGCDGQPSWLRAESAPNSNQIVMVDFNITTFDICAQIWNGTSWESGQTLTLAGETTTPKRGFDIAPEYDSGRMMVAYAIGVNTTAAYRIWNGAVWSSQGFAPPAGLTLSATLQWISLGSDFNSNRTVLAHVDSTAAGSPDLDIWHWNGTAWGTGAEPDSAIETLTTKDVAAGFAGLNGTVLYGSGAAGDGDFTHVACVSQANCQSGTWTSAATVSGCNGNINWVDIRHDPVNTSRSMAVTVSQVAVNNICIRQFNNATWNPTTVVGTGPSGFESASFSYFVPGLLNVSLFSPPGGLNITHNSTFNITANVSCINGPCGTVTGTARYNTTGITPDTNINGTEGEVPFYTMTGAINQSCGIMNRSDFCQLSWIINATGNIWSIYNIDVNFTSDNSFVLSNATQAVGINITQPVGYLSVILDIPDPAGPTYVIENKTFNITANVTCINGTCGMVNGTVRYNFSSPDPDTYLNDTQGDSPFHNVTTLSNQTCGVMNDRDFCQLSWLVNASGKVGQSYFMDVNFTTNDTRLSTNDTLNAEISTIGCIVDFSLQFTFIDFGELIPNTQQNPALRNVNNSYNITVNPGSCSLDFYIKGTDLTNITMSTKIGVGNMTWSNASNSYATSLQLTDTNVPLNMSVFENSNVTSWYWINVPPVEAGIYNGTISISGVEIGQSP